MRLKHIPGAEEYVAQSEYTISDPQQYRGRYSSIFGGKPIRIEIGMGKGAFITSMASDDDAHGYIGIERYSSVLMRGIQKLEQMDNPPANLRFMCMDAGDIEDVFDENEIDRIYLNFSDPWPKDRHAKRRLTHHRFLGMYHRILVPDGIIEFKTDNTDLFDFSVNEIKETPGWEITALTRDLHNDSKMMPGNVMTEYEKKFSDKGNPICKVVFKAV